MQDEAVNILAENRLMAISTIRPDGWPQTTIVGYANEGLALYFIIFRASQKFQNITKDQLVSIAVGKEPPDLRLAKAVYAAAFAAEITDPAERDHAWRILKMRHPNLVGSAMPDKSVAAMMRAECSHLSIVDYSKGLGHTDALHLSGQPEGEP
jgi:nitroimidazol reductase NimA-like FMN-containing flavoprotein (pyridoxamine 5'-phosphate oxidase superfamily)